MICSSSSTHDAQNSGGVIPTGSEVLLCPVITTVSFDPPFGEFQASDQLEALRTISNPHRQAIFEWSVAPYAPFHFCPHLFSPDFSPLDNQQGALWYAWMQGPDLNRRPPGYEPGELPDCSTLRYSLQLGSGAVALRLLHWQRFCHNKNFHRYLLLGRLLPLGKTKW